MSIQRPLGRNHGAADVTEQPSHAERSSPEAEDRGIDDEFTAGVPGQYPSSTRADPRTQACHWIPRSHSPASTSTPARRTPARTWGHAS